ncbi:hypothetical protein CVT26_004373 [Gymnopilus dilepis]|uniref:Uncharacterized protein n=1 Tax=Gymnopilus dilepis TaxID=231916 RepID=A0A409WU45_9AGAR|nr:hypothetical protein CVT26_004373 [Gymnopilus dilepis]
MSCRRPAQPKKDARRPDLASEVEPNTSKPRYWPAQASTGVPCCDPPPTPPIFPTPSPCPLYVPANCTNPIDTLGVGVNEPLLPGPVLSLPPKIKSSKLGDRLGVPVPPYSGDLDLSGVPHIGDAPAPPTALAVPFAIACRRGDMPSRRASMSEAECARGMLKGDEECEEFEECEEVAEDMDMEDEDEWDEELEGAGDGEEEYMYDIDIAVD